MRQLNFSRGIKELTLPPNPRWSTHKGLSSLASQREVITKNASSLSLERRASNRVEYSCSWGSYKLQDLTKSLRVTKTASVPSNTKSNKLLTLHLT